MTQVVTIDLAIAARLCKASGFTLGRVLCSYHRHYGHRMWEIEGREMFPKRNPRVRFDRLGNEIARLSGGRKRLRDKDLLALFKDRK
ncbi:hypothetical protein PLUTO_00310 [Luteibacter phage vB_LflM-Pluto]|uniref:Uncharacterized protein n=1 Tax=Luteibacter phage vB_LflM-Pluto TaxID=2948611 RepID=A0A9E7SN58_9CAUD|nr:hypothetical protein PLUTO_00310 [Luteibacter phage vB_LflM-Pluto]